MELIYNPWIVGIGTTVVAGLITAILTPKHRRKSKIQKKSNQIEYELELQSFRNDMVRRGLAHTSIRIRGEAALKEKYGIMNSPDETH